MIVLNLCVTAVMNNSENKNNVNSNKFYSVKFMVL